jgi:Flp pilus assembly pilin Flp
MLRLMRRIHEDEQGAVSLETILIVGAIALPILIFLIKVGWPRVKSLFTTGMEDLESETQNAAQ